ncbi:MAG TPA: DUF488 domain-containing protein [Phycisphaerae bacterium]|jgi:uncharacterized protein (DUF488 family)|nr:DUF488 domain-containing protein [Phycisphaerae bacterium]
MAARPLLFTVGHSNQECAKYVDLLLRHGVTAIADVRSQPYSQYTPQFNRETLEQVLALRKIKYVFLGRELGARREERECYVAGQARYDLIRTLPAFVQGLERLRRGVAKERIAMMCSEKDPLTCHRTILVCRELRAEMEIQHVLEDGALEAQSAAETRLLALMGLPEGDLFHDRSELIERAYDKQALAIAYTEQPAREGASS